MKHMKRGTVMSESDKDRSTNGTVKVDDQGQVVNPAEARRDFNAKPRNLLPVAAGRNRRGIPMTRVEAMRAFASKARKV
jgi:bifunctional DNA-binding transcriptional regulator/antitoxin component of YhaV-PrlF toxin-antitoxin module